MKQKNPEQMLICNLEVLLMPNGEVISGGKPLGWYKDLGKYLTPISHADGSPVKDGEFE